MLPASYHIQIPTPCSEDWNKMDDVPGGKHCESCSRNLVDFSVLTDQQILSLLRSGNKICGRFAQDQLEKVYSPLPVQKPWLKYFFTVTIPALLFSLKSTAQKPACHDTVAVAAPKNTGVLLGKVMIREVVVFGWVTDSNHNPIPFASVIIKGTNRGTATDERGYYRLQVGTADKQIEAASVGFDPVMIPVNPSATEHNFVLKNTSSHWLGEIVVTTRKKSYKFFKPKKDTTLLAYPNPIQQRSTLNLRWSAALNGDVQVELYNLSGALIQQEVIACNSKTKEIKFRLVQTPPGTYVVKATDIKSHKKWSEQLVVE